MHAVAVLSDVTGATITCGRSYTDAAHSLEEDDGDETLEGRLLLRTANQWRSVRARVTQTSGLQLFAQEGHGERLISSAQITTIDGSARISPPKTEKVDHPYCLRVDLPVADEMGW